ncbi:facilitated trehalose transporter Tret1-like [Cimex lectularius]|uniref:Major facilitator superfamily (MFS) profile domain-containing protein n=1 Tax=Cimex lectularius TaxID=79782 RepID=A0A8I6TB31_CIMLE|nr:facilitated trehalose transporter Tret1-like [Cimex lectularius]
MGRQIRQWLACLTCTISVAMTGTSYVWTAPLLVRLTSPESPLPMTSTETSWISSFIEFGELFTTIPVGLLADRYGRKTVMQISAPLILIGWILTATTRSIPIIFLVRIIHGIALAISFTVVPMYIAEVAEPKIRGVLAGQFQSMWYLGCLYAYISGPYLSYNNYVYVCAIVPVICSILFLYIPESPYYLLMANNEEKASESLSWLRGGCDFKFEFQRIKESVEHDMKLKGSWRDLFATKTDRKSFLIVQFCCLIKYLGGMAAVAIYASQTFHEELSNLLGSDEMTIVFGVILFLTTFSAAFLTDKIGRKPLLIFSSGGAALFSSVIALIYYLDSHTELDVSSYKWISYVAMISFSVITNIGLGPLMQTIQAEYFPSHTRAIAGGITEMVAAIGTFVCIIQYQTISDYFGTYMNYVVYCVVNIIGMVTFAIVITETAGKSLGQIQDTFQQKTNDNKISA